MVCILFMSILFPGLASQSPLRHGASFLICVLAYSDYLFLPNDCDNRVAAVDLPFVNALSATPRSSLGYPPFRKR